MALILSSLSTYNSCEKLIHCSHAIPTYLLPIWKMRYIFTCSLLVFIRVLHLLVVGLKKREIYGFNLNLISEEKIIKIIKYDETYWWYYYIILYYYERTCLHIFIFLECDSMNESASEKYLFHSRLSYGFFMVLFLFYFFIWFLSLISCQWHMFDNVTL